MYLLLIKAMKTGIKSSELQDSAGGNSCLCRWFRLWKTTILNLAIGFLKADSGQVLVDGNDLMELDLHSYRKQIAVVPQQSILFTGTLRENITYGSESISEEQLWNVIRAANLEEVVQKLPDGLDTMITEHGENLSGGQRQRISIARAFYGIRRS